MFDLVLNTPLFIYSYMQMAHIFTIIVLIVESKLKHINTTRSKIVGCDFSAEMRYQMSPYFKIFLSIYNNQPLDAWW